MTYSSAIPRNTEPQYHLQTGRTVELQPVQLKQMFGIFECFFYFEAVVINPDNLGSVAGHVIGEDIPGFIILSVLVRADNPKRHPEQGDRGVLRFEVTDGEAGDACTVIQLHEPASLQPDVEGGSFGMEVLNDGLIAKASV